MQLDTQKYMKHLEGFDLTEAQKVEYIHNLAKVLQSWMDKAFGQHPVQQSIRAQSEEDAMRLEGSVSSNDKALTGKFRSSAGELTEK